MADLNLMGLPLLADSLDKNGLKEAFTALQDDDVEGAFDALLNSEAAQSPIAFTVSEGLKWKLYKELKKGTGTLVNIMGFTVAM
jgi:hypothetical protein